MYSGVAWIETRSGIATQRSTGVYNFVLVEVKRLCLLSLQRKDTERGSVSGGIEFNSVNLA